jgi:hypothetical protein
MLFFGLSRRRSCRNLSVCRVGLGAILAGYRSILDSVSELVLWTIYPGARGFGYVIRMAGYQLSSLGQRRGLESSNIALIYLTLTQVVV